MDLINLVFEYIPFDYILIVGGLIVLGEMFKKFTTLPNYFLTTVLPILGAIIIGIIYATGAEIFIAADFIKQVSIGLILGWAATGGYEWFQNLINKKFVTTKKVINYEIIDEDVEEEKEPEIIEENKE
ncbi:MAG: hypothetical protein IJE43_14625 [Alphaproteobacteria bacterium]|nr:hypothetical protein [Alphaproteobacteria bacterium]